MTAGRVVTVTPTIMDGTVVRWYVDLEAAERHRPFLSASRNRVTRHEGGVATPEDVEQALDAYEALRHDRRADVARLETHRRAGLCGPFVPVVEPSRAAELAAGCTCPHPGGPRPDCPVEEHAALYRRSAARS